MSGSKEINRYSERESLLTKLVVASVHDRYLVVCIGLDNHVHHAAMTYFTFRTIFLLK